MSSSPLLLPETVKAARALLDWQQADLARAAGLSVNAIAGFEQGGVGTRKKTLATIRAALEEAGIEFISGGLRRTGEVTSITRHAGKDFVFRLNEDFFAAVRKPGAEIYDVSTDDRLWALHGRESHQEFKRWVRRMGIRTRTLAPEGATRFNFPRQNYRVLPPELIGKLSYCIYADRVAYVLWRKMQIFTIRNATIAGAMREQFRYLWRLGRPA